MDGAVESKPVRAGNEPDSNEKDDIFYAAPTSSSDGIGIKSPAIAKDGSIDAESAGEHLSDMLLAGILR